MLDHRWALFAVLSLVACAKPYLSMSAINDANNKGEPKVVRSADEIDRGTCAFVSQGDHRPLMCRGFAENDGAPFVVEEYYRNHPNQAPRDWVVDHPRVVASPDEFKSNQCGKLNITDTEFYCRHVFGDRYEDATGLTSSSHVLAVAQAIMAGLPAPPPPAMTASLAPSRPVADDNVEEQTRQNLQQSWGQSLDAKAGPDAHTAGLLITQPSADFADAELSRIDEYVMQGHSLVIAASAVNVHPGDPTMTFTLSAHGLPKLLSSYGIHMQEDLVLDLHHSFAVKVASAAGGMSTQQMSFMPLVYAGD